MILFLIASVFLFSSCAEKVQYRNVYVPVKCQIPEIEEPQYIKPSENTSYPDLLKILLENYRMCRVYSEKLKQSMEVCK
ncbi:MAG: hypothetical protein KNN13_09800 [Hydrogenobacter thermophilus]|uniref:hypothetical protein n=1 Tax=Hydrogenobacter thermophilus TaxID=940 RepID=UPI001C77A539|nr:hypothetical protein [Hydrogenobacter thermophilus]QWK19748.1 MAG: hypothetical protein KNN13_09800 [Hydrogenobacter thermophilus]